MVDLKLRLTNKQKLVLTPELRQALQLLQMPALELRQYIQQALDQNIMLEAQEPVTLSLEEMTERANETDPLEPEPWERATITLASTTSSNNAGHERELAIAAPIDLRSHLLWQLEMGDFSDHERMIGRAIIDAIDEDGYLRISNEELQSTLQPELNLSTKTIVDVLAQIQDFDPNGVATRNLEECLQVQLRGLEVSAELKKLAAQVIANHLPLVASRDIGRIAHQLEAPAGLLEEAVALIRALDPHPGRRISDQPNDYIIPDIVVIKQGNKWTAILNQRYTPELRINKLYADAINTQAHSVMRSQLQEARWLVRGLELRKKTLLQVAEAIVMKQQNYFARGDVEIAPMQMQDIADLLGIHESTVSRVTANKYMHTPRGVVAFRHFFSIGLGSNQGDETSAVAIRALIRNLINSENSQHPLSDQKLVEHLLSQGIEVSRRTVAKYRMTMNIPSAAARRIEKQEKNRI